MEAPQSTHHSIHQIKSTNQKSLVFDSFDWNWMSDCWLNLFVNGINFINLNGVVKWMEWLMEWMKQSMNWWMLMEWRTKQQQLRGKWMEQSTTQTPSFINTKDKVLMKWMEIGWLRNGVRLFISFFFLGYEPEAPLPRYHSISWK